MLYVTADRRYLFNVGKYLFQIYTHIKCSLIISPNFYYYMTFIRKIFFCYNTKPIFVFSSQLYKYIYDDIILWWFSTYKGNSCHLTKSVFKYIKCCSYVYEYCIYLYVFGICDVKVSYQTYNINIHHRRDTKSIRCIYIVNQFSVLNILSIFTKHMKPLCYNLYTFRLCMFYNMHTWKILYFFFYIVQVRFVYLDSIKVDRQIHRFKSIYPCFSFSHTYFYM